jgi:outer membrane receptor protein involved in Fe transport
VGPPTFEADRLKSYEAGVKAETADRRFGVDLASYYIDWSNIQIIVTRGAFSGIDNAPGGASVRGAELTLTSRPTNSFTVTGAFAYQDASMSQADPDLGADKGERLPNVPRFTAALSADYELPVASFQPTIGATLRYIDDRTASFDSPPAAPQYHMPDYVSVDLRAGFTFGRVNAQLYVRNLFDEIGQVSATTLTGQPRVAILQPRTIGISATMQF